MTVPDILDQDPDDAFGVAALAAAIRTHLSDDERRQFDVDLRAWNRRYAEAMRALVESDEWREIEQWRSYILSSTDRDRIA